jgi:hypothetical protein
MPKEILALATEWATATDGSLDPFSDGILYPFSEEGSATYEAYRSLPSVQNLAEGDQLSRDATCSTFEAQVLSCQGARKGLSTIFLAIALVVGGVAALQRGRLAQNIVLATSVTALIAGPEFSLSRPMSTERELTKRPPISKRASTVNRSLERMPQPRLYPNVGADSAELTSGKLNSDGPDQP